MEETLHTSTPTSETSSATPHEDKPPSPVASALERERSAETCPVCLETLVDTETVRTACDHAFCESCLSSSLDHRAECPMCRSPVSGFVHATTGQRTLVRIYTRRDPSANGGAAVVRPIGAHRLPQSLRMARAAVMAVIWVSCIWLLLSVHISPSAFDGCDPDPVPAAVCDQAVASVLMAPRGDMVDHCSALCTDDLERVVHACQRGRPELANAARDGIARLAPHAGGYDEELRDNSYAHESIHAPQDDGVLIIP